MHYTALQNYSVSAGRPSAQKAPAMAATYSISAASGELMIPENAGVVLQAKSGINAIRVSGTSTTTAGIGVPGANTTANQIQFYSNDSIVAAFDQDGLYFPNAKSNALYLGTLGYIQCNTLTNIGTSNLTLKAVSTTSGQNPSIIFNVQNPPGTNDGLEQQTAGYINNGGMTLNNTCPLTVNSSLTVNTGLTVYGYYRNTSNTNFNTILLQGPECPNQNGAQTTYAGDIILKASDLVWGNRSYGCSITIQGGRSVNAAINHGSIFFNTANATRLTVLDSGAVRVGSLSGNSTKGLVHIEGSQGNISGQSGYYTNSTASTLNYVGAGGYGFISLFATNDVVAGGAIGAYSDGRIKTNIKPIENSLEMINKIKLCSYNFIDQVKRGDVLEYGIIAQELNEVCPNVIKLSSEYIPNIYRMTDTLDVMDDTVNLSLPVDHDLEIGDFVKIILKDKDQRVKVISIDNPNAFTVKKWDDCKSNDNVFVYGKEVDDFKVVDKIQLALLSLGGVKDLHSLITLQQKEVSDLKYQHKIEIDSIKTDMKRLIEQMERMESNITK